MRVKDICTLNKMSLDKETQHDSYLYLDTSNLFENAIDQYDEYYEKNELPSRAKRVVKNKDILFSTIRPNQNHYGIMEEPPDNLLVSTGFAVITAKSELVDPYYLYYFLTKQKNIRKLQMIAETAVSSYPSIRPDDIGTLKIKLPKIAEQEKIVKSLNVLEEKIRLNYNLIEKLEKYCQLQFYKWFVDFNFPSENSTSYKDNGGEMQKKEDEMIPDKWEIISLGDIVKISTDTLNPQESPDTEYKYYSIPVYDETKTYIIEHGSKILSNKYLVNSDNLLISKLNPWFKRVVYPMGIDKAICSTEFVVLTPEYDRHLEFLYVLANTTKFTRNSTKASTGTSNSHRRIKPNFMMKYKIPYNQKIATKFNDLIKPVIEKIHIARNEIQVFEEYRDILIKKQIN